ncbi:MAG: hypothetical protein U5L04_04045 [Trueperaceae bacterium]|nr:hypothetical protein [Trueperaceae bacterium]
MYGSWYYVHGAAGEPVYFAVAWDVSNSDGEVTYRARVAYDAGVNSPTRSGDSGWGVYDDASAYIAAQLEAFLAALAQDGSTGIDNPAGGDDDTGVPPEYSTYWYWMAPPYGRGELEAQFIGGRNWEAYLKEFVKDGHEKVSGMAEGSAKIEAFRAWVYYRAYTSIHVVFGFVDDTGTTNATTGKTYYYDISSKRYEMFERRAQYWLRVYRDLGGPWRYPSTRAVVRGRSKRGW